MKPFHIVKWDETFENAKSRNYKRCSFLCLPNRHDDLGFLSVLGGPEGPTVFGLWVMVAQICSRQERPRDGWLTVDGTPNGKPYTLRELSWMLRSDICDIALMLRIVSSPSVRWIEPNFDVAQLDDGDQLALSGKVAAPELTNPQSDTSGTDGIGVGTEGATKASPNKDKDKDKDKNESKARNFESRDGGSGNGASADITRPSSDTISPRADDADAIQHAEAKLRFAKLCQDVFSIEAKKLKGAIWPNDWEHWLNEALPLSHQDLELIEWAYRTAHDDPFRNVTRLRQSFTKLMENLPSEAQKIASARKQIGLNGLNPNDLLEQAEPEGWRAIANEEYPGTSLPETWAELPAGVRSRIQARISEPRGWRDAAVERYGAEVRLPEFFNELSGSTQREILDALKKPKMETQRNAIST